MGIVLSQEQFEVLQFAATKDAQGRVGIRPQDWRRFGAKFYEALNFLQRAKLVKADSADYMVATEAGEAAYEEAWTARDEADDSDQEYEVYE